MLTERRWKLELVPFLLLGVLFCLSLSSLITQLAGMRAEAGGAENHRFLVFVVNTALFQGVTLTLLAVFFRVNHLSWTEAYGFDRGSAVRCFLYALLAGLVTLPMTWLLNRYIAHLIESGGAHPEIQYAVRVMQESPPVIETTFIGLSTIFLAPLTEECLFRGLIYPSLKQMGYPRMALYGTCLLFAAVHFNLLNFLPLVFLSLVLTLLYEVTDNLLAPIFLHSLFNAANFWVLLSNTDLEKPFKRLVTLFQ